MGTWLRRCEVRRIADPEGRTLCFMIFLGSRRAGWKRFERDAIPDFEGQSAWFEVERDHRGGWRFVRRLPESD